MNIRCQAPGCGNGVMFPEDKIASWGNVGEMAKITGFGFVFSEEETLWFCPECRKQLSDLGLATRKILGCGDVLVDCLIGRT